MVSSRRRSARKVAQSEVRTTNDACAFHDETDKEMAVSTNPEHSCTTIDVNSRKMNRGGGRDRHAPTHADDGYTLYGSPTYVTLVCVRQDLHATPQRPR